MPLPDSLDTPTTPGRSALVGGPVDGETRLASLSASEWALIWANLASPSLPTRISHEIRISVNEFSLRVMAVLSAMGLVCTVMVVGTLVPNDTTAGRLWIAVHLADYLLIAIVLSALYRRCRRGTLTTRAFSITALPVVIICSTCWGTLPLVVGPDPIAEFYLASCISAMLCFFGFFWTAGQWPLSVLYASNITALMSATYFYYGLGEAGLVTAMLIALLVVLVGLSVMSMMALVNARYETVLARERKQMVQLLLLDYERGGHDWLWETDEAFHLTHVPPRMGLAANGDSRFRPGASLLDLVAGDQHAVDAIRSEEPFQTLITGGDTARRVEIRLWGRPNIVGNRCLGYLGVGSDEGAARRAAQADRTRERLDAMIALTSGLAHDFNNLLATILGSVELANAKSALDDDVTVHLNRAADACLRTRRITADLAAAAGHDLTTQSAPFDLGEAVRDVVNDVRPLVPDVILTCNSTDEAVWTLADRSHCTRSIRNLVDNALQAIQSATDSQPGRIWMSVSSERDADDLPVSVFSIRDNGPGIPDDLRHRLFEPFFTTRRSMGGTGLGLAVASGFARQAGGDLYLDVPDRGASFRLVLPSATAADLKAHDDSSPRDDRPTPRCELGGHFLVVEDDLHLADTLSMWIESFGGTTDTAGSVHEAVVFLAQHHSEIACVISDLVLPDGEGFDVIAALRDLSPETPAVYVSGFTRTLPSDVEPHLQCPFVAKPFSTTELLRALSHAGFDLSDQRPSEMAKTGAESSS